MFQLARRLRDIQTSINSKDFGLLVNIHETENICKDKILSSFLCVLALSSVICLTINLFYTSCGFQKYKKMFNQNIYFREKSDSIFFFFVLVALDMTHYEEKLSFTVCAFTEMLDVY